MEQQFTQWIIFPQGQLFNLGEKYNGKEMVDERIY